MNAIAVGGVSPVWQDKNELKNRTSFLRNISI